MLCEVSFLQFEKFHKHIDTVFLRIDIKRLLLLVVRAQRNLVWKKIIIKMCHLKGLFRIQAFFFFFYDYNYNTDFWVSCIKIPH